MIFISMIIVTDDDPSVKGKSNPTLTTSTVTDSEIKSKQERQQRYTDYNHKGKDLVHKVNYWQAV